MNRWYSARPDEIFLDLDSNRATARALSVLRLSLRRRHIRLTAIHLYQTPTRGHAHLIITLKDPMDFLEKMAWSLWLGNDRLRVAYVLERYRRGIFHCDLLVSKTMYHRMNDAYCHCTRKHKKSAVTEACPAMDHLLGDAKSADYFTRTGSAPPKRKIRVPWGRLNLMQVRNWSEVYE